MSVEFYKHSHLFSAGVNQLSSRHGLLLPSWWGVPIRLAPAWIMALCILATYLQMLLHIGPTWRMGATSQQFNHSSRKPVEVCESLLLPIWQSGNHYSVSVNSRFRLSHFYQAITTCICGWSVSSTNVRFFDFKDDIIDTIPISSAPFG